MKIFIVFGTRPEVIKLAPVVFSLKERFDVRVVSTGQHLELTQQVINFFRLRPHYSFGCMTEKPDLEILHECIQKEMRIAIDKEEPDLIIVQGDTLTTYAAAFVGFMLKKPVFHVEAGLRSFRKYSPFPEEVLRVLVSRLVDFHFAPTHGACENLLSEGIRKDRILITGNTVVDALLLAQRLMDEKSAIKEVSSYVPEFEGIIKRKRLILITAHRRENIGEPLKRICDAIWSLSQRYKGAFFLWPLHRNPDVRSVILDELSKRPDNIAFTEALSYQGMIYLMKRSYILMTDSGGIQEEASAFGKPVMVLRDTTERPEIVDTGIGFLVGSDVKRIVDVFSELYENKRLYASISMIKNPFGDGKASKRVRDFLMLENVRSFIKTYPSSCMDVLDIPKTLAYRSLERK
ncbi:MAG: UDP-N-acetylglucosamine 2-epimerase (non-hydrolyzing) [Thermodesulfovibrionia bacterium]